MVFMVLLIGTYLFLMFKSGEFQIAETSVIATMAALSMVSYAFAVCVKPEYDCIHEDKTDEEFLELLKTFATDPSRKVCAYC